MTRLTHDMTAPIGRGLSVRLSGQARLTRCQVVSDKLSGHMRILSLRSRPATSVADLANGSSFRKFPDPQKRTGSRIPCAHPTSFQRKHLRMRCHAAVMQITGSRKRG